MLEDYLTPLSSRLYTTWVRAWLGFLRMSLVVKRVKGKLYVYEQYRLNGKVVTKYIGPLEELVRIYQVYRLENQVNYRITRRDIRRISRRIAMDVVNFFEKRISSWCGGWDLNPRRPTPSGPEPDPFDQARAPPRLFYWIWALGL